MRLFQHFQSDDKLPVLAKSALELLGRVTKALAEGKDCVGPVGEGKRLLDIPLRPTIELRPHPCKEELESLASLSSVRNKDLSCSSS